MNKEYTISFKASFKNTLLIEYCEDLTTTQKKELESVLGFELSKKGFYFLHIDSWSLIDSLHNVEIQYCDFSIDKNIFKQQFDMLHFIKNNKDVVVKIDGQNLEVFTKDYYLDNINKYSF